MSTALVCLLFFLATLQVACSAPLLRTRSSAQRYLVFTHDVCAGYKHTVASISCAMVEATKLNRTLVLPELVCSKGHHINGANSFSRMDTMYDMYVLKKHQPIRLASDKDLKFHSAFINNTLLKAGQFKVFVSSKISTEELRTLPQYTGAAVIMRGDWRSPRNYWKDLCAGVNISRAILADKQKALQPPANVLRLVRDIKAAIGRPFGVIHVRRGDKAKDKQHWPNLDRDTQGPALLANPNVAKSFPAGSIIYIATDEQTPHFFDALKQKYTIYTADNFLHLLKEYKISRNSYAFAQAEYTLFDESKVRLDTFPHLTKDKRDAARPIHSLIAATPPRTTKRASPSV